MTRSRLPSARLRPPALVAGTFLFGTVLAGSVFADPVVFAYAPAAGKDLLQREVYTESSRAGGVQETRSVASEVSVRISREAGFFFVFNHVARAAAARNGKPSDEPMVAALAGTETLYVVHPNGVLATIDGLQRVYERLLPALQGEMRSRFERRLRENRIEDRTRALWFDATEILAGQTLELDRDYFFDSAWPTDEGWIRHQTLLRLGPWETSPRGPLLRLAVAWVADARAAVPGAQRLQPRVPSTFSPALPGRLAQGLTLAGNASRLVDPATLTVWRDQSLRQLRKLVPVSEDLAITVSSEERSDITLEPARQLESAKPASN